MATVRARIVILTVWITLSVCPFNRMAHTANNGVQVLWAKMRQPYSNKTSWLMYAQAYFQAFAVAAQSQNFMYCNSTLLETSLRNHAKSREKPGSP
jgi:hypothetical protein